MGVFSWFSKSSPPDYETLLARLSTEIDELKTHLSEIRLRERRWSLLVSAYGVALWALWVGLWWLRRLPFGLFGLDHDTVETKALGGGGLAAGPIMIWLLNRGLHFVFARQRNSSETHLRVLLSKQRKHLEEIKKATNYDSTRKLIERYDDPGPIQNTPPMGGRMGMPSGFSTPVRKMPDSPSPAGRGSGGSPRAPGHLAGAGGTPAQGHRTPADMMVHEIPNPERTAAYYSHMQAIQPVLPTPEKKWYDRVVDSILGEDPSHAGQSKFALVCGECFRHNGLVGSKYEWERMQWICPRCNHMNPPPLSRQKGDQSAKPATITPLAQPVPSPATPSHLPRSSSHPRRQVDRGTPRSSKLGQEVFSASEEQDGGEDLGREDVEKEVAVEVDP